MAPATPAKFSDFKIGQRVEYEPHRGKGIYRGTIEAKEWAGKVYSTMTIRWDNPDPYHPTTKLLTVMFYITQDMLRREHKEQPCN